MWTDMKNPQDWLWIILPIGAMIITYLGIRKKNAISKYLGFGHEGVIKYIRYLSLCLGLLLIFMALLGPQKEVGTREVASEGRDIYFLIDTSKSMLAEDVIPSRLEHGKKVIHEIISGLTGDRVGFIPYASSAYIQMPLTDDYNMANMFLDVVDTDMVGGGGTDMVQAISLALNAFNRSQADNQLIIIVSDGEEEATDLTKIKELLDQSSATIFTIGVGTEEGSLIPIYSEDGQSVESYKKDELGQPIMTKLDETALKNLANMTGGSFYISDNNLSEVDGILKQIHETAMGETSIRKIKEYDQLFQWYLGVGLAFLLIGLFLPVRRGR